MNTMGSIDMLSFKQYINEVSNDALIKRFAAKHKVEVDLNVNSEPWHLNRIVRQPNSPPGSGSKVMQAVSKLADRENKRVELIPLERDKLKLTLSKYYRQFGYRQNPDKLYKMTREPITEAKLYWGEDADSPVYENPSKSHLKALSKEGVIGWRWLQQGKKIYVGNASHYIHDDIATAVGIKASMENPIRGGMSSVERLAKDGYDVTKGGRSMVEISRKNWILPPKKERVEDEYGYDVDDNEWDGH